MKSLILTFAAAVMAASAPAFAQNAQAPDARAPQAALAPQSTPAAPLLNTPQSIDPSLVPNGFPVQLAAFRIPPGSKQIDLRYVAAPGTSFCVAFAASKTDIKGSLFGFIPFWSRPADRNKCTATGKDGTAIVSTSVNKIEGVLLATVLIPGKYRTDAMSLDSLLPSKPQK